LHNLGVQLYRLQAAGRRLEFFSFGFGIYIMIYDHILLFINFTVYDVLTDRKIQEISAQSAWKTAQKFAPYFVLPSSSAHVMMGTFCISTWWKTGSRGRLIL
jgi:hypothetical protein